MDEKEEMRNFAEAHGCGYRDVPIRETAGGGMICKRVYEPVRPLPCIRDEHGEIKRQTVKALFTKINEELDELKAAVLSVFYSLDVVPSGRTDLKNIGADEMPSIASEAADTITSITTMLEALGIDADMRGRAQHLVNEKNRRRGRLGGGEDAHE